eukprot:TRINITY_DN1644_c0_g1_i2.p1 TRINITY_DN1644_c0_g1~~TRINITY_DN1644_c0_g1_i2.p1  ORF type:complete len:142 (-),score=17.21 TRINITY_DN1644_c0_g1_i2:164-589(-)
MGAAESTPHYHSTHVANACSEPIYVMCTGDKQYAVNKLRQDEEELELQGSGGEEEEHSGFTRIAPRDFFRFTPFCEKTGIVYVSIYVAKRDKKKEVIASAVAMQSDYSLIVDRNKNLKRTMMRYIWMDEDNVYHNYWSLHK